MVQTFGTNMCPHFRRDSSCTSLPCCHSPRIQVRCIGSRRCGTSGTWILPSTRSTVCTDEWTHSRQSRPPCTCFLQGDKPEVMVRFRKWSETCTYLASASNMEYSYFKKVYFFAKKSGFVWDHSSFLYIYSRQLRTKTTVPTQLHLPELVLF